MRVNSAPQATLVSALRHRLTGENSGAPLPVDCDLAVDENERDPCGELLRVIVRGVVDYAFRVENYDVGKVVLLDAASSGQAETVRRVSVMRWTICSRLSPSSCRRKRPRNRGNAP